MRRSRGSVFVVSAPSGAGKTSLCQKLCSELSDIKHSVSFTTRQPRQGELDGVHYHFVNKDTFLDMVGGDEFVEWAEVFGNYYGTSRKKIEQMTTDGIDVILDIDVQGGSQIRERIPEALLIFIMPPSMEVLRERLTGRQSDSSDVIMKRLAKARDEMKEYKYYDYVIVNDAFEVALRELSSVIIAERVRVVKTDHAGIEKIFSEEGN